MTSTAQFIKIFIIFLVFVSKGLYNELAGPAMIDLKLIFNTSYAKLTQALSYRGIGGIVGAILGGVIADKFDKRLNLCVAMFCALAAVFLAYIPISPAVDYLPMMYFGLGCSTCVQNICLTRLVLNIFKEKNAAVLQVLHMGYGIGALLTPLLSAPFLATVEVTADKSFKVIRDSRVQVPFFIIAAFSLVLSIPFLFWHFTQTSKNGDEGGLSKPILTGNNKKQRKFTEMLNPASYANGNFYFGSLVLCLLASYYCNIVGCEKVFGNFVRTFSVETFKFDKNQSSYLNTLFWVSFTLGRFFASFISGYFHIHIMITVQASLHLCSVIALKFYLSATPALFWLGTFCEGFLISPLYGLGISFGSSQIEVSGMILTVLVLASSIGDLVYLQASGKMLDLYGPSSIISIMHVSAWLIMATVVSICIFRRNRTV